MDITVDVNWEIMPPRSTFPLTEQSDANPANDQWTQSDQPFGPEPQTPAEAAPEVNGK